MIVICRYFCKMTDELEKLLRRDRSALAENPYVKNEQAPTAQERAAMNAPPLEPDVQKHLTNFSLLTHGFATDGQTLLDARWGVIV